MKNVKTHSTEELFESISQFISESKVLIEAGKFMELSGLDAHVKSLCAEILNLSQDERVKYAGRLQQLFDDLKALGDSMVEKRDIIAGEINHISQHKKATSAYRTVDTIRTSANKDEE